MNKVEGIINDFGLVFDERAIIVTDRGSNMIAAFKEKNRICCVNHLIHNTVEEAVEGVAEIAGIIAVSQKIVKYFKKSGINSSLRTKLKSFAPTRWNTVYYLLFSIQKNWQEITAILLDKGETQRLYNININLIECITTILAHFEEASRALEAEKTATMHIVLMQIFLSNSSK